MMVLLVYFNKKIRFVNSNDELHIIGLEYPKLLKRQLTDIFNSYSNN